MATTEPTTPPPPHRHRGSTCWCQPKTAVPTETLRTLLDAWATLTSDPGRGFTKARLEVTDDAYDALRDLLPPEAVYCPLCTSDDVNRTDPAYFLRHGETCSDAFHDGADIEA